MVDPINIIRPWAPNFTFFRGQRAALLFRKISVHFRVSFAVMDRRSALLAIGGELTVLSLPSVVNVHNR